MNGRVHYEVLRNSLHRDDILEHAKENGVSWEEHSHPGINWMRASSAIIKHIDKGNKFHTDGLDLETGKKMLDHYIQLREAHKKTMIPHIRSAVAKLHAEKGDSNTSPMDLLEEAHEHLKANGGHVWAEKLSTLHHINMQIKKLSDRIDKMSKAQPKT